MIVVTRSSTNTSIITGSFGAVDLLADAGNDKTNNKLHTVNRMICFGFSLGFGFCIVFGFEFFDCGEYLQRKLASGLWRFHVLCANTEDS